MPVKDRHDIELHMPQNIYIYDPNVPVPEDVQYVEIPEGITVIREEAFAHCPDIQSVTIPDSVTMIGDRAFADCSKLQSVTIPNSVTEIKKSVFWGCASIRSVVIPDSVTKIGEGAFYCCSGLQSVTIPDGVTEIGKYAFADCSVLQSITMPGSVTKIGDGAFCRCSDLRSVVIPDCVTEIGNYAFAECSALQSVTIPDSVISIGDNAFFGCYTLQSVVIPDNITDIGEGAFLECSGLQSVTISDSITEIANRTFEGCVSLQSVTIPDGVTEIGDRGFANCAGLQSVTIPDSVIKIGNSAFGNCFALRSVQIPDGVTKISDDVFSNCGDLQSVTVPDSVTTIGSGAFQGCINLQSITIPDGVTEIDDYAFRGCSGLQFVVIPDGVTEIGEASFRGCSRLRSVTLPNSITRIGYYAFHNCYGLQSVNIPDSATEIGGNAFSGCHNLRSIVMPDSITEIGEYAFCGCSGLQSVTIPRRITNINDSTFRECSGLQSVTIPDGVISIGDSAFARCSSLQIVTLPDSVSEIACHAFWNCSNLQSVTVPDSTTMIGQSGFAECPALRSVAFQGINIAPFINISGYGVNTFYVIKELVSRKIPLTENTVKFGIDMGHYDKLSEWARNYRVYGTIRLLSNIRPVDKKIKKDLRQCFEAQKKTGHHVPKILGELAATVRVCEIPPERLTAAFDIRYTGILLRDGIPIVPAEACRCYYDRNTCDMLIRKNKISVMAEAIALYNKSGHRECYRHLMDFIRLHPDTVTEDLLYAVDNAAEIPMRADTTLAQVRQHRTYMENLAEVAKIEAQYGKIIPGFKLSDYSCSIEPAGITYGGMTARVLNLSDKEDIALAARLGNLTDCCQGLGKAGETAMMHGFLNPDAGFWVIEDKNGTVKAQAEIWKADKDTLVFDNIEFANTDDGHRAERAEQLRGVIAAWATESGYRNIIMGCGYNELGTETMERAPIPGLCLTPEEIFALQRNNDAEVFFDDINEARQYMQTDEYNPGDFVYTDANEQCVYIRKNGTVSDYLMQGYDERLAGGRNPHEQSLPVEKANGISM